ncbi:unnamed protein product [Linum trigynum]|uniref:Uncharacterized protein n=1 Tax=Linum trigynum TaxID=586398 RepID=A0AAV2FQ47_9ROSI
MAKHTSRIVELELQMANVRQQMDSQHTDLKAAIAALASSTKENLEAITASLSHLREKSPIRAQHPANHEPLFDNQQFRPQ